MVNRGVEPSLNVQNVALTVTGLHPILQNQHHSIFPQPVNMSPGDLIRKIIKE